MFAVAAPSVQRAICGSLQVPKIICSRLRGLTGVCQFGLAKTSCWSHCLHPGNGTSTWSASYFIGGFLAVATWGGVVWRPEILVTCN